MQWVKLDNNNWREACDFIGKHRITSNGFTMTLWTSEGPRMLCDGSYIVRDENGGVHCYDKEEFEKKFTSARGVMDSI